MRIWLLAILAAVVGFGFQADAMLDRVLREGRDGNRAAGGIIRQGVVVEVRPTVGDTGLESLLYNVEVRTRHGGRRVIYGCQSNIPVQVGSQVWVNIQNADAERGGAIVGLTTVPIAQEIVIRSPEYTNLLVSKYVGPPNSGFGPYTARENADGTVDYLDNAALPDERGQNREVWISNNVQSTTFSDMNLTQGGSAVQTWANAQANTVRRAITAADIDLDTVFAPAIQPAIDYNLHVEEPGVVMVTGDVMGFEAILNLGSLQMYKAYQQDFSARVTVDRSGNPTYSFDYDRSLTTNVENILTTVLLTVRLTDPDTEAVVSSDVRTVPILLPRLTTSFADMQVRTGNQEVSALYRFSVDLNLIFAHEIPFFLRFSDLETHIGRRLRADLSLSMRVEFPVIPSGGVPANTTRFNGRWTLTLRETGYGSALREF